MFHCFIATGQPGDRLLGRLDLYMPQGWGGSSWDASTTDCPLNGGILKAPTFKDGLGLDLTTLEECLFSMEKVLGSTPSIR